MFYMHHDHTVCGRIRDEEGYDHLDEKHMRWEAMCSAREMIGFAALQGRNALDDRFQVTDGAGRHKFTLRFGDSLDGVELPKVYVPAE